MPTEQLQVVRCFNYQGQSRLCKAIFCWGCLQEHFARLCWDHSSSLFCSSSYM